jgi:tetratricopeptide (TPR) repeat protein
MSQNIHFVKGEVFHKEEGKCIEFKREIDSTSNFVNGIVTLAEKYVIGFLNAIIEGELYIGIDNSGIIVGIPLNRDDRDKLSQQISNKLRDSDPPVPMSCYEVETIEIFDALGRLIEDLNIVRIRILQADEEEYLYKATKVWFYTTDKQVFYKKGTNCFKLNSQEIAAEIRKRTLKHLRIEADKLDEILKTDPNNVDIIWQRIGNAKGMGDIEALDSLYAKLFEITKSPKVKEDQAKAHKTLGDLEGAETIINEVIQSDGSNNSNLKTKGEILQDLGRWEEAYQSYKQAYDKNTDDYTALTQIGIVLRKSGRYKESIQYFNDALKKAPNYRLAKYEKKATYYEMFKGGICAYQHT